MSDFTQADYRRMDRTIGRKSVRRASLLHVDVHPSPCPEGESPGRSPVQDSDDVGVAFNEERRLVSLGIVINDQVKPVWKLVDKTPEAMLPAARHLPEHEAVFCQVWRVGLRQHRQRIQAVHTMLLRTWHT